MKIRFNYILLLIIFLNSPVFAQQVYHEVGFGVGPVNFRGDWGERGDSSSNLGNTGFGVTAVHFANFAYGRNSYKYFHKHFKLRNQFTLHQTNLNHFGRWVRNESQAFLEQTIDPSDPRIGPTLENMSGKATVIEIGTGLDWNWNTIRDYERQVEIFQPYAGFGINLVYFNPEVDTSLPGRIGSIRNTWGTFLPGPNGGKERISNSSELTAAVNFQTGTRYRVNEDVDLFIEARWHYYFSDFVDGLNPRNPNNKVNDWMFFLKVGFAYYFD
ncbi:THC0290_0291 family protein [Psychroflexus salis]|uniref:Glutamate dehydrogenase n=1 Tax=Psychroflexus salis TaxID=1526574 RepID=A0A916ZTR7_9FLAO|nr:hypothetical protein [Psychroflexus salis]GGE13791.1 glutamate dehydrogenase [Psychroflexus salis]